MKRRREATVRGNNFNTTTINKDKMMNILGVFLAVCVGASQVAGYHTRDIDYESFDDESFELFDGLDEVKKSETWAMEFTFQKERYQADFKIQRMSCWDGAFKGTGVLKTKVN